MSKNKYYSVVKGNQPGVYNEWFGSKGAEAQIKGFAGAIYKGFPTFALAEQWFMERTGKQPIVHFLKEGKSSANEKQIVPDIKPALDAGKVVIFTDGACTGNPGPGGYGAVMLFRDRRSELSGGYRLTTNNRMELMACIRALQALKMKCSVVLHSDSRYVVDGITKGWARRWEANGWKKSATRRAINPDLWAELLDLIDQHEVEFVWVEGHAGVPENERCDHLSVSAAQKKSLPPDLEYEKLIGQKSAQMEMGLKSDEEF